MLSEQQIERYSRQILIPQVGGIGQEKLLAAQVAICGGGEAALTAATYLAAAGIGTVLVHETLQDAVTAINEDCVVHSLALAAAAKLLAESVERSTVVLCLQTEAVDVNALRGLCAAAQKTLVWGCDRGVWAILNRAQEPALPLCVACLIEAAATPESQAAAFWVGSQLAAAAMAAIVGLRLPAPGEMQSFDVLTGGGASAQAPCRHQDSKAPVAAVDAEDGRG